MGVTQQLVIQMFYEQLFDQLGRCTAAAAMTHVDVTGLQIQANRKAFAALFTHIIHTLAAFFAGTDDSACARKRP